MKRIGLALTGLSAPFTFDPSNGHLEKCRADREVGLAGHFRPSRKPFDRDFRGFPTPQRGNFPLSADFRQTPLTKLSWDAGHGEALQLHQAAHGVGEVLRLSPRLGPHQPDAAHQRPAHVVALGPEHVLDTRPNLRTGLVAPLLPRRLRLVAMALAVDPALQALLLQLRLDHPRLRQLFRV